MKKLVGGFNIVYGNIVKWGTKQVFGNYEIRSITVMTVIDVVKWGTKQVFVPYDVAFLTQPNPIIIPPPPSHH